MSATRWALELVRWALGGWLIWRVPAPARPADGEAIDLTAVSVVVPARNEQGAVGRLVASLPPGPEVLVVDDHSGDGTAAEAAAAGAAVVSAPPLPPGWTGKAHACAEGAGRTRGDVLVFLDADTWVRPGGLEAVVGEQRARGGLVSVQPRHEVDRPYERLSAFFNLIGMMGVGAFTPLGRRRPPVAAFGPCLVVDRTTYQAAGGHAHPSVRGAVLDDVALAGRVRAAGGAVTLFGGGDLVAFRMYPGGVRQLIEGWTKNFAGGAASTRPATLLLVVAWLSGAISAAWYPVAAAVGWGGPTLPGALLLYTLYVVQLAWAWHRIARFGAATPLLYPLPLGVFLLVFGWSVLRTLGPGRVRWRGRTVPVRQR